MEITLSKSAAGVVNQYPCTPVIACLPIGSQPDVAFPFFHGKERMKALSIYPSPVLVTA
jgi:hypothetical protein